MGAWMLRGRLVAKEDDLVIGGRSSCCQHLQTATIKRILVVPIWGLFDSCHLPHAVGLLTRRILWRAFIFRNERHGSKDSCSLAGLRVDGKSSMDQIDSFLHAHQAQPAILLCFFHVKACACVADDELNLILDGV